MLERSLHHALLITSLEALSASTFILKFPSNFFKALPIKLVVYNAGSISSAAVLAHKRKTSAYANFMIHRTFISPQMATSDRLQSMTKSLIMDDERSEAILKANIRLGDDKWVIHQNADLWLSAQDAGQAYPLT